ncbi:unnamed protein product, partial [Polarella glacialis]
MPPQVAETSGERFLAPVAVLALHGLLLADVAFHRKQLLEVTGFREVGAWALALAAVLAYLRTVISDPGFLRVNTTSLSWKPSRLPQAACCLVAWLPAGILWLLGQGGSAYAAAKEDPSAAGVAPPPSGAREVRLRDLRSADALELQPIGRSALDAIAGAE